jgi:hypothetical protein
MVQKSIILACSGRTRLSDRNLALFLVHSSQDETERNGLYWRGD